MTKKEDTKVRRRAVKDPNNVTKSMRDYLMDQTFNLEANEVIDFDLIQEHFEGKTVIDPLALLQEIGRGLYIKFEKGNCLFKEGNVAKVVKDTTFEEVRYISTNESDGTYFYLSAGDILSILWQTTHTKAGKRVAEMVGASFSKSWHDGDVIIGIVWDV